MITINIKRKPGWDLNPNDNAVNSLLKMIARNEGLCPCSGNDSEDKHCPCTNYLLQDKCICGLYKKI